MIVLAWIFAVCFLAASLVSLFYGLKALFSNVNHGEWESAFQNVSGTVLVSCSFICGFISSILFWFVTG